MDNTLSSERLGMIGLVGVAMWVVIVAVLHLIKSELDPVETYVSDYAIGENGWLMTVAFLAVGLGTLAVAAGLLKTLRPGKRVKLSVWLTGVAGIGFLIAGAFTTAPTGVEEDLTTGETLHVLGALLVFPVLVVQSFVTRGVFRRDERWSDFAAAVRWFPYVLLLGLLVSFGTGDAGEGGPVGLTQRIYAAVVMIWLATLAWRVRTTDQHP